MSSKVERFTLGESTFVIGVDRPGGRIIERLVETLYQKAKFVNINRSASVGGSTLVQYVELQDNSFERLKSLVSDASSVIVIGDFGETTGAEASTLISEVCRSMDILTIGIALVSSTTEGIDERSDEMLDRFESLVDTLFTLQRPRTFDYSHEARLAWNKVNTLAGHILSTLVNAFSLRAPRIPKVFQWGGNGAFCSGSSFGSDLHLVIRASWEEALGSSLWSNIDLKLVTRALIQLVRADAHFVLSESVLDLSEVMPNAYIVYDTVVDSSFQSGAASLNVVLTGFSLPNSETASLSIHHPQAQPIAIVWDPDVVSADDYATLVQALGDLVRCEGGIGITRTRDLPIGILMSEDLLV